MVVQHFLKGITGIPDELAEEILRSRGIPSRWFQRKPIYPPEVIAQLTDAALLRHLNDYVSFGPETPFISTTAGCTVRDAEGRANNIATAEYVATDFATDGFLQNGWVFSGYVFTLGRKAVAHRPFAEEVRELNLYTSFLPFQPEGELVAKIHIPATQLEKAWPVTARPDPARPGAMRWPKKGGVAYNTDSYVPPEDIVNLRDVL